MITPVSPLAGPPPDEIPLPEAPLIRVVAQVRFPLILSIENSSFVAPFQEAIRGTYPILQREERRGVMVGPEGDIVEGRRDRVWRFRDQEGHWSVGLGPEFLALETQKYKSRNDFMQRLEVVLKALMECANPSVVEFLGIRYIDRAVRDDEREKFIDLMRGEVRGILDTPLVEHVGHAVSENTFNLDGGVQVIARWGLVPPNATFEAAALEAIDQESWLLDIDTYQLDTRPFDVDDIVLRARSFAERIYSIFRWAVTDEFLKRYGGKP